MAEVSQPQLLFLEKAYPFDQLPVKTRFVDVASGLGHTTYFLARKLPAATFTVQDHPTIIARAKGSCPVELRERITFVSHDMFTPQPDEFSTADDDANDDEDSTVFLLKSILHDWPDPESRKILTPLLSAMHPHRDRILIVDTVIDEELKSRNLSACVSDMLTMSLFGARHRTLREFRSLINAAGKAVRKRKGKGKGMKFVTKTYTGGAEEFDGMMVLEVRVDDGDRDGDRK